MEQRSGVEAALAAAEAELEKAGNALSGAEARSDEPAQDWTNDDRHIGRESLRALARRTTLLGCVQPIASARERADELEDCLLELLPWTGGRDELLSVPVPTPDQLQDWASTEADLSRESAIQQGELDRLGAEAERLEAKIEALGSAAGVISDQEAGEARSAREAAWAVHKAALDATTAAGVRDRDAEARSDHGAAIQSYRRNRGLNCALLDRSRNPGVSGTGPTTDAGDRSETCGGG